MKIKERERGFIADAQDPSQDYSPPIVPNPQPEAPDPWLLGGGCFSTADAPQSHHPRRQHVTLDLPHPPPPWIHMLFQHSKRKLQHTKIMLFGGGGGGSATAAIVSSMLVCHFSRSCAKDMLQINPKVPKGEAKNISNNLYDIIKARCPLTISSAWDHVKAYRMTEAGPVLSMCSTFAKIPSPAKSSSCGTVVRNRELKVIDTETGFSLGRNQPGEICIRGPQIMKGYLNDPITTSMIIDVEGWLHTGDVGLVDDDEVFIVDRVKELVKFKGFQVPPAELEALLVGHPSIVYAAVVPKMDDITGEVPVAFIVRSRDSDITEQAVKEFISKQENFLKWWYFTRDCIRSISSI